MLRPLTLLTCLAFPATAQKPSDPRLDWWREARFGMFIHWGLYAVPAGEWNGKTSHGEWIYTTAQIPMERYQQFRGQFNPVKFDAAAWVSLARAAGMKYIVITSKHHDGFCLFDSKHTDHDVMSTPFRRDILKELAEACGKQGIRMCWYHSIMDWHHPDYLPRRDWEKRSAEGASFPRYVEHLHAQVTELLTNYGKIGVLWFDGEWESTWTHALGKALYIRCRELQPDLIVNNRVDVGRGGMAGFSSDPDAVGDFGTPEQEIPETGVPGVDWESCMTMNGHWGYNKHDQGWKSARAMIRMLVDCASKGGNYLLNIGPTAEGEFPPACVERLKAIGAWMGRNSESIQGTTASPFPRLPWGRATTKGERLYLHVFDWPKDGALRVPQLGNDPRKAHLLAAPDQPLTVTRDGDDVLVRVPAQAPDADDSVVVLELPGAPVVFLPPVIQTPAPTFVQPMTVTIAAGAPGLQTRFTTDGSEPGPDSKSYSAPFAVSATTTVKARSFFGGRGVGPVASTTLTRATPLPATGQRPASPGFQCATYRGAWSRLPDFAALTPESTKTVAEIGPVRAENTALRYTGMVEATADGMYVVALASDDGSRVTIAGQLVVDHDGLHGQSEKRGFVALAAGWHPLTVEWFNQTGGAELSFKLTRVR